MKNLTWETNGNGDMIAWSPSEQHAITWWVLRTNGSLDHYDGDATIKPPKTVIAKTKRKVTATTAP